MEGVLYLSFPFIGGVAFILGVVVGGGAEKYILIFHCPETFDLV